MRGPPSPSLTSGASRSRLAAQRHISASSCGSGLGRPAFLDGTGSLGRQEKRGEPAVDLVVMLAAQAGRDAPPEDPPLGPALHVLRVLDALVEDRPEGLEPDLVEREAAAGPEREAGEVEPARFVLRALQPLIGQVAQRLPAGTQRRGRPLVARNVEQLFEPLDQTRRARSRRRLPRARRLERRRGSRRWPRRARTAR